ncbi:MAG: hypothetical protein ACM31J_04820 [Nitrososphaerales archaeon]
MEITEKLENIIRICRYEDDVDKKVLLLLRIDNLLPKKNKLKFPSFVTRDYIDLVLNEIEKKMEYQMVF